MRILVFGANGQVAKSFAFQAPFYPELSLVCKGQADCDITDKGQIIATLDEIKPDLIVNTAAYTAVDQAEEDQAAAFLLNETAVGYLGEIATVPIVHFSTDYVFNGQACLPYQEGQLTDPLGIYGQSKWAGEEALRASCPKHVILRTAWVYSPFGGNFVKTMLRIMNANDKISVVSDQIGCPTSALDLADAVLKIAPQLINQSFDGYGTYHIVTNAVLSWHDFAVEIKEQTHMDCVVQAIETSAYPTKAQRPAYSVLSCHKFEAQFGFNLPDWKESLSFCLKKLDQH
ncbi:dTDP-4-dehydrorhamnose reductase [Terasakiella sp. SH-1]|uniref:dTDP-4-dehydrorhamnose reductase n=1 Tax=Terasakiella sp. SH-1 TaxID=2560057 RepID=UPI0010749463|nr:dTDP-4-dehydrorhamnose reductase [Terasakiella sp. SH-1]